MQKSFSRFKLKHLSLLLCSLLFLAFPWGEAINAGSTKVNQALLVGEWSQPGQCGKTRYIYTRDGKYIWMENKNGAWVSSYQGIYLTSQQDHNSIVIGDGPNMGGYVVDIRELTRTTLKGEWRADSNEGLSFDNPNDALFSYIRCPGTVFKP